jgi:hypothetical protein
MRRLLWWCERANGRIAQRGELDGFAGEMTRLRGADDAMQATGPVAGPSNALVDAMQTGDRLSYYPGRIDGELVHFRERSSRRRRTWPGWTRSSSSG